MDAEIEAAIDVLEGAGIDRRSARMMIFQITTRPVDVIEFTRIDLPADDRKPWVRMHEAYQAGKMRRKGRP